MADFPRTVEPMQSSVPSFPGGEESYGHTGKAQQRNTISMGREWEEVYPPLSLHDATTRAWLANINRLYNSREIFDAQNYALKANKGTAASATVNGADQTGTSLNITMTGTLVAGDIIRIAGLNVVFDVIVGRSGSGAITISPGIPEGSSPSGSAVITTQAVKFRAVIPLGGIQLGSGGILLYGTRIRFREQP